MHERMDFINYPTIRSMQMVCLDMHHASTYVDEAVMKVEADEAGRDARVGDPGVLDDPPDNVPCARA
jgi:hypothetical protein